MFGLFTEIRSQSAPPDPPVRRDRAWRTTLWLFVAVGAASQLLFHRASIDDPLYVSFTV